MTAPVATARTVAFVGAGPRTLGIVERLVANAGDSPTAPVAVHVIDPHPAGGGRIWRHEQSPLLWMNSEAQDVTVFTDDSVDCAGPVHPGPSLSTWSAAAGAAAAAGLGPRDFAPRVVQAAYLRWVWGDLRSRAPAHVTITEHRRSAVGLVDQGLRQMVTLDDGTTLLADLVVLAQGYLPQRADATTQALSTQAADHRLTYVAPGHTADLDLSGLRAGEPVVVRGMGLAFIDLMVLIGEGRGGRFSGSGTNLTYHPSGAEPLLHVGSRRGVPYHAKLGYEIRELRDGPAPLRHFTRERLSRMNGGGVLDFERDVWPLLVLELALAHYGRLFDAHPERTQGSFAAFERGLLHAHHDGTSLVAAAEGYLLDPGDVFDIARIDRPLAGLGQAGEDATQEAVLAHVATDLARRADPAYSPDRAVFDRLLSSYSLLVEAVSRGRLTDRDRVRGVEGAFHGLFSFLASGPPPRRLAELLALHRAGIVRFLGPDTAVQVEGGEFVARSAAGVTVRARAAVEARLPRPDSLLISDPLVARLLADGDLLGREVRDIDGSSLGGGQLVADGAARAVRADGTSHPRRFLLGPAVSGSAGAGGFARPGFNSPAFRQNDAVARDLLTVPLPAESVLEIQPSAKPFALAATLSASRSDQTQSPITSHHDEENRRVS